MSQEGGLQKQQYISEEQCESFFWVLWNSQQSCWCFSEVVGEINHVATETEIEVGRVKVLKKVTLFCKLGSEKVLKDHVLLKEIPRPFLFSRSQFGGTFENFSRCFAGIFFCFFFCCFSFFFCFLFVCFCSMWKVVCLQFMMFFLLLPLKFLVGMSSLFRVFIHVFGVNQCGV